MKFRQSASRGRKRPEARPAAKSDKVVSYRSLGTPSYDRPAVDPGRHRRNETNATGKARLFHNLPTKLALIGIVGSLLYVTTLDTQINLTVQTLASDKPLLRSKETYQLAAQDILQNSLFNKSKLTINVPSFEKQLKDRFHELEAVSMTLPLIGHQPVVNLISKRPVLKLATSQGVYLLDRNGVAMIKASEVSSSDGLAIPLVTDESQLPIETNNAVVLTADMTSFITSVHEYLTVKGVTVASMTLPAAANELQMTMKDKPFYIRFSLNNDPAQSAGEYLVLEESFRNRGVTPGEYIDLRVSERAFYK